MPTPISAPDKANVIAIVAAMDAVEADKLLTVLINYEDIVNLIARQVNTFEYYPDYLKEIMEKFTNTVALANAGIVYNDSGTVSDPMVVINSAMSTVGLSADNDGLGIFNSTVDSIVVAAGKVLSDLWIAPGSTVKLLDSSAAGAFVNNIWIRNMRSAPASLMAVKVGSNINQSGIHVDAGAFYGGITDNNVAATCAQNVTGLAVSQETHNSIKLTWTNPVGGGYISIQTFYRKSEAPDWILADTSAGDFMANNEGFIFRKLEKDTNYDFKVVVTCINGGEAIDTLSGVTICC